MSAPFDRIIVLDAETTWGRAIKLGFSCQTMEEYIRDPRFKAWGLSWKWYGSADDPVWVSHADLPAFFASIDWSRTAAAAQNAPFDISIMAWHYDVHPAFVFDTLSMGRALHGVEAGNSLKTLAERYGLPPKGQGLASSENILDTLPPEIEAELSTYCCHDTWLCEQLLMAMMPKFPTKELKLIDMTTRMYTQPRLVLDSKMLQDAVHEDAAKLIDALGKANTSEAELASNQQFAAILERFGVEAPTKTSKTTGRTTLALAKNDAEFQALLNHDNEDVVLLCEARLKVKSTLERTRAQRFLDISQRGALPVPLAYFGALTGRWQALRGSAINMQNMKRGSFLRRAIMAPEGYAIGVGDLSQIEPRVLAWLADYDKLLDIFRAGGDPYATFGTQMFNLPGLNKEEHPVLRQSSKSALLGAGYQLGWASFAAQLLVGFLGAPPKRYTKAEAKDLGVTQEHVERFLGWQDNLDAMAKIARVCTDEELLIHCLAAKAIIDKYRAAAEPVVKFWEFLGEMIHRCLLGGEVVDYKGCLQFRRGEIELANGMVMQYPDLEAKRVKRGKKYVDEVVYGRKKTKLYPGKVCNNVTQGSARIIMSDGMLRVNRVYPVVLTVHDELGALIPMAEAKEAMPWVLRQMTVEPKFMPGIPLAADGGYAVRYGDAKQ